MEVVLVANLILAEECNGRSRLNLSGHFQRGFVLLKRSEHEVRVTLKKNRAARHTRLAKLAQNDLTTASLRQFAGPGA